MVSRTLIGAMAISVVSSVVVTEARVTRIETLKVESPVGGFIPFARAKAERLASGDPGPSLEERYQTHDGYVQALSAAARSLVKSSYLRQADADAMITQAEESSVLR